MWSQLLKDILKLLIPILVREVSDALGDSDGDYIPSRIEIEDAVVGEIDRCTSAAVAEFFDQGVDIDG